MYLCKYTKMHKKMPELNQALANLNKCAINHYI